MKYSIGIPAYKGRYLNDCIDSILSQIFKDFELIVINDCSPDRIYDIVKAFDDPRINYYENEVNIGAENVIDNWNKCLSLAKGDFFILMGDDDKLAPDYLSEFDKLIAKYPDLDIFHCRIRVINEKSEEMGLSTICPEYEDTDTYILNCIESRSEQFISDFVYRKSTLLSNGGFYKLPLAWSSDYISAFIACGDKGIAYTERPLLFYRKNQYNITSTSSLELKRIATIGMENWIFKYLNTKKKPSQPLTVALKKYARGSKESFIQQMLGRDRLMGLYLCIVNRKMFKISVFNFMSLLYNMWLKNSVQ
nr:glycosyltransferase family 2 protein [uncultured Flavobacterium sp.]